MTIEQALKLFYASEYGEHKRIAKYVKTTDGYILFPRDGLIPLIGVLYYMVTNDGMVKPVHPMLCKYDVNLIKSV